MNNPLMIRSHRGFVVPGTVVLVIGGAVAACSSQRTTGTPEISERQSAEPTNTALPDPVSRPDALKRESPGLMKSESPSLIQRPGADGNGPLPPLDPAVVAAMEAGEGTKRLEQLLDRIDLVDQDERLRCWREILEFTRVDPTVMKALGDIATQRSPAPSRYVRYVAATLTAGGNGPPLTPFDPVPPAVKAAAAAGEGTKRLEQLLDRIDLADRGELSRRWREIFEFTRVDPTVVTALEDIATGRSPAPSSYARYVASTLMSGHGNGSPPPLSDPLPPAVKAAAAAGEGTKRLEQLLDRIDLVDRKERLRRWEEIYEFTRVDPAVVKKLQGIATGRSPAPSRYVRFVAATNAAGFGMPNGIGPNSIRDGMQLGSYIHGYRVFINAHGRSYRLDLDPSLSDLNVEVLPNTDNSLRFQEILWIVLEKYHLDFRTEPDGTFMIFPKKPPK